ncbi:hypothetical protein CLCY_10c00470 [Clostridium cylindrosporum DSM 605]|uniref:Uncharacterized protein n=1 Tax=Clostridium cylindrosporum DSM 605 TaxID=1121307 RepID=A0A0J8D9K1_CLOCY|nr:hypothetical protein CLCY_10c00470 [Clostridium cylindrosporum DSM 605]
MWDNIRKTLYIIFAIYTAIILFIIYKNIEFPFSFQFILGYLVIILLLFIDLIITVFFSVRKLKSTIIRKMIFRFITSFFVIWSLTVLLVYLTKGELRITDKIFSSIAISFGSTFGSLLFENKKVINKYK